MTMNEASYIIKKSEDDFIDKWNQTRFISYSIIQSQSTKKLKPTDIMEFPWEKKPTTAITTLSKEDLIKHAKQMEKIINNNGR